MAHNALHYRYNPLHQDIICSETAIATLPATIDALGASRAMITCGPTILRACNVVPRVQEALGYRYVGVYAGVAPHAPVETVEEGVAMASLASFGGLGLNTATCHHVGGLYNVPHGEANAILLPHTMRYNLDACADRQRLIAEAIGVAKRRMSDEEAGLAAADAVDGLCRTLELPRTLREVDVPEDGLALIAAATLHDRSLSTNPKPINDAGPIMDVLRAAY
jgi:alcohol dehydrogenase class IV